MTSIGDILGDDPVDFVWFNETSKRGGVMGKFRGLAVFAADGYHESILKGHTYLCSMSKKGNVYNARPIYEITPESLAEEMPDLLESMCEHLYRIAPEQFDSAITATQIRMIREEERERVSKDRDYLRKENERLREENSRLREEAKSVPKARPTEIEDAPADFEGIRDDMFVSPRLDGYYSLRISWRGSEVLLVRDDDGPINGCGGCVDLTKVRTLLGNDIHGEYCDRYDGVLFTRA